jgi:rubrerythrin
MNFGTKKHNAKGCTKSIEDTEEYDELNNEKAVAEVTSDGKYRCRYCGLLFESMEAHDKHYRKVHGQSQAYLRTINQS